MQPTLIDTEPTDAELLAAVERAVASGEWYRFHLYRSAMSGLDTGTCADCGMDKAAH